MIVLVVENVNYIKNKIIIDLKPLSPTWPWFTNAMMVIKWVEGGIHPNDARYQFRNAIWRLQNDKKYKRKTFVLILNIKPSLELSFWPALILNNSLLVYMESRYQAEVPPPGFSCHFWTILTFFRGGLTSYLTLFKVAIWRHQDEFFPPPA